jgi:hypothetical protein
MLQYICDKGLGAVQRQQDWDDDDKENNAEKYGSSLKRLPRLTPLVKLRP